MMWLYRYTGNNDCTYVSEGQTTFSKAHCNLNVTPQIPAGPVANLDVARSSPICQEEKQAQPITDDGC